ncbi:hypothetical protein F5Y13DRAFT_157143 [Hypoxylon sp. FL1857]|nr:hypothetical protein F5Y13DRAFT_157143 [Hypoxylon sp. FL1857]
MNNTISFIACTKVCTKASTILLEQMLSGAGFAAGGIAGGSLAARLQSFLKNIPKESLFATLQSARAGGFGVAVVDRWIATVCAASCNAVNFDYGSIFG